MNSAIFKYANLCIARAYAMHAKHFVPVCAPWPVIVRNDTIHAAAIYPELLHFIKSIEENAVTI